MQEQRLRETVGEVLTAGGLDGTDAVFGGVVVQSQETVDRDYELVLRLTVNPPLPLRAREALPVVDQSNTLGASDGSAAFVAKRSCDAATAGRPYVAHMEERLSRGRGG